jgi:ankyrin repeat protein
MAEHEEPGRTLHEAAAAGDVEALREIVKREPHLVSRCDEEGWTALHRAAREGRLDVMRALLELGADVEDRSCAAPRVQPLHEAVRSGGEAAVALLLAADANPNARRDGGFTPLHDAVSGGQASVVRMLVARGADPRAEDANGRTAVDVARDMEHGELLALLTND